MSASQDEIRQGLLVAACIGFLAKHNASISGAEVGCQGEVGVASAMAAAALAYARGYRFQVTENAAEIAMEHHLGLTCDPVGGYVQIPCIERNAMGAVKALNAYLIASTLEESYQKVDFDKVIQAMAQTGRDMSRKYKETSLAGLAMSMTEC
jgi:L-serine dehydratase